MFSTFILVLRMWWNELKKINCIDFSYSQVDCLGTYSSWVLTHVQSHAVTSANSTRNRSSPQKLPHAAPLQSRSSNLTLGKCRFPLCSCNWPFPECHTSGVTQGLTFSLSTEPWVSIRGVAESGTCLFVLLSSKCPLVWTGHRVSVCWPSEGHCGCFQFWAILHDVAVNIGVHVFVWASVLNHFR